MNDHQAMESEGPMASNWLWAVVAALAGAIGARWLGDVAISVAVLFGAVVFLVYAVVLAQFWEAPVSGDHGHGDHGHDDHGHGDHGHGDHGHDDHGHDDHGQDDHGHATPVTMTPTEMAAPAMAAPVSPSPVMTAAPAVAAPVAQAAVADPVSAPVADASNEAAVKPQGLSGPRDGKADDLQEIEGVGPVLEKLCHELGIFHFDQIAAWGGAEIAWMDSNLKGFKGRVTRDKWVVQAKLIGAEGLDAFRLRAKTNDY